MSVHGPLETTLNTRDCLMIIWFDTRRQWYPRKSGWRAKAYPPPWRSVSRCVQTHSTGTEGKPKINAHTDNPAVPLWGPIKNSAQMKVQERYPPFCAEMSPKEGVSPVRMSEPLTYWGMVQWACGPLIAQGGIGRLLGHFINIMVKVAHDLSGMKWAFCRVDEQASHLPGHGPGRERATHLQKHVERWPCGSIISMLIWHLMKWRVSCLSCGWAGPTPTGAWACKNEGYPAGSEVCRVSWALQVAICHC